MRLANDGIFYGFYLVGSWQLQIVKIGIHQWFMQIGPICWRGPAPDSSGESE